MLSRILGRRTIMVNGRHHQAIKDTASELSIVARASDHLIEAVEWSDRRFVLGVQWHPEGTWRNDPHSQKLFKALVKAAASK